MNQHRGNRASPDRGMAAALDYCSGPVLVQFGGVNGPLHEGGSDGDRGLPRYPCDASSDRNRYRRCFPNRWPNRGAMWSRLSVRRIVVALFDRLRHESALPVRVCDGVELDRKLDRRVSVGRVSHSPALGSPRAPVGQYQDAIQTCSKYEDTGQSRSAVE